MGPEQVLVILFSQFLSRFRPPRDRDPRHPMERAKRIDVFSRVLFPMVFAVFNLSYWTHYLSAASAEYESTHKT